MLILVGLTVAFFTAAFIIIDPPPYPYFDWEPYFDQAYQEDGCEGAERFVMMSRSKINGPNVRLAHMFLNGDCLPDIFEDSDPNITIEYYQPGREPGNTWLDHVDHYAGILANRTHRTHRALKWVTELLDTPSRRELWPHMIWFQIRCGSEHENPLEIYLFRQSVAEYYDEGLRMPNWEARLQSCSNQIYEMARYLEETETVPPADRVGLRLNNVMAWWVFQGSMYFNSDQLRQVSLKWDLHGTALRTPLGLDNWCPTDWSNLQTLYQDVARQDASYTLLNAFSNALDDRNWIWQDAIANLHSTGHMLPQSDVWFYYWLRRAEISGSPNSQSLRTNRDRLSVQQQESIDEYILANQFPPNRPIELTQTIRSRYQWALEQEQQETATMRKTLFQIHG